MRAPLAFESDPAEASLEEDDLTLFYNHPEFVEFFRKWGEEVPQDRVASPGSNHTHRDEVPDQLLPEWLASRNLVVRRSGCASLTPPGS